MVEIKNQSDRLLTKRNIRTLFLLLGIATLIRLFFFSALWGQDDVTYIYSGYKIAEGIPETDGNQFNTRKGILWPIALTSLLTGANPDLWPIFNFLCSLGTVALAWIIGLRWFDRKTGLTAAFLIAFLPNNIHFAGLVHVDIPSSLFTGFALFLLWPNGPWKEHVNRTALLPALFAGGFIGWAYLTKETSLFILPWLFLWACFRKDFRKPFFFTLCGVAFVGLLEGFCYHLSGDSFFYRLQSATGGGHVSGLIERDFSTTSKLIHRLTLDYPSIMFNPFDQGIPYLGLLFPLLALSIFWILLKKVPQTGFLLGWWGIPTFLIIYLPVSLNPYIPALQAAPRYLEFIAIPAALLIGRAFATVKGKQTLKFIALSAFAGMGILGASALQRDAQGWNAPVRQIHEELSKQKPDLVSTDIYSFRILRTLNKLNPPYKLEILDHHLPQKEEERFFAIYKRGIKYQELMGGEPVMWVANITEHSTLLTEKEVPQPTHWRRKIMGKPPYPPIKVFLFKGWR